MRVRKYFGLALILCVAMVMTGCGTKFPELTEEEYNHTVEYAAGLLMRYSNNGQERLIYVDAKELEKQRQKEAKEAEKEQKPAPQQTPATPAQPVTPVAEPEPEATVPEEQPAEQETAPAQVEEQTPAQEETTEETQETSTTASDPNAVVLSSDQSEEITQDIFLSYQGYMVTSTYPESSKSYVVNSDKGKKLLVLRFDLYNASDSSKSVNMIPLNLMFQILLNGKNLGYSSVTFLPNDLSSYTGTIDSRAHESVVVLTQIGEKDANHIDDLGMIVTINGQSQTVSLR